MIDVLDKLKYFFKKKDKKNNYSKGSYKQEKEDSSLCSLLDYHEKKNYNFSKKNAQANDGSVKLSMLNPVYTTINISLIIILLSLKFYHAMPLSHDHVFFNITVPCYFQLYMVNPLIFHIYYSIIGLLSFLIMYILYTTAKLKLDYIKDNGNIFQLKRMLLIVFGLMFNVSSMIEAFVPLINMNEIDLKLFYLFLFIINTFSIVIFGTLMIYISNRYIDKLEQSRKWFNSKLIVLIYLTIFSLYYIALLLNQFKIIDLNLTFQIVVNNFEFALHFLPYLIKLFSSLLILSYYDEMKSLTIGLSIPNLEIKEKP